MNWILLEKIKPELRGPYLIAVDGPCFWSFGVGFWDPENNRFINHKTFIDENLPSNNYGVIKYWMPFVKCKEMEDCNE